MLQHRLLLGALFIAVVVGLIWADAWLAGAVDAQRLASLTCLGLRSCDGAIVLIVLGALVILGTRELHHLFRAAGHAPLLGWPSVVNVGLLLIAFYTGNAADGHAACALGAAWPVPAGAPSLTVGWLTLGLIGGASLIAFRRRTAGAIGAIATTLLMVLYLGLLPQYLFLLRYAAPGAGPWLLLYFLGVVKFCDIGAYFTGRAVGRHRLIAWLSPKKTVEGLAGGIAASAVFAVFVPILVRYLAPASAAATALPGLARAAVFGVAMALLGQAGDLLESLFKRDAREKDSANLIPAFGGVLDILDSLLLAAPVAYWILLQSQV